MKQHLKRPVVRTTIWYRWLLFSSSRRIPYRWLLWIDRPALAAQMSAPRSSNSRPLGSQQARRQGIVRQVHRNFQRPTLHPYENRMRLPETGNRYSPNFRVRPPRISSSPAYRSLKTLADEWSQKCEILEVKGNITSVGRETL